LKTWLVWLHPANGAHQRGHKFLQGLPLRQTTADKDCQTPQALGLGGSTPIGWAAIKIYLELTLKFGLKVLVILGCTQ
jgi:hypothetical protein